MAAGSASSPSSPPLIVHVTFGSSAVVTLVLVSLIIALHLHPTASAAAAIFKPDEATPRSTATAGAAAVRGSAVSGGSTAVELESVASALHEEEGSFLLSGPLHDSAASSAAASRRLLQAPPSPPAAAAGGCPAEVVQCPNTPAEMSDFYFEGNEFSIPTWNLAGATPDQPIGGPIRVRSLPAATRVTVGSSGVATFFCTSATDGPCDAGNQFYAINRQDLAWLSIRTVNRPQLLSFFEDRCVKLPLTAIQITEPNGSVINLNPGDNNQQFPEDRRNIVFKTGPNPPTTGCAKP